MTKNLKTMFLTRLNKVLNDRGILERERSGWLRDLLDIDMSSAGRKLKGYIAMSIDDLAKIASNLNCTTDYLLCLTDKISHTIDNINGTTYKIPGLVINLDSQKVDADKASVVSAVLDNKSSECIAWISTETAKDEKHMVAWKDNIGDKWIISTEPEGFHAHQCHSVYAYARINPSLTPKRIAVLDDRDETAELMCQYLEQAGYVADKYISTYSLSTTMGQIIYDGYVLDWSMGNGYTSEQIMVKVRKEQGQEAPIILMTGEASESDAEHAIEQHGVVYFQKSVKHPPFRLVIAQLKKALKI
jgi:CheY-like chemotaxis protein